MRDVSLARSDSPERFRFVGAAALALKPQRGFRPATARRLAPVHKHGAAEVSETAALVVDPDTSARSLLAAALRRRGFEVTVAASAEEAVQKLGRMALAPELVLSEIALPGADGYAFCEQLQERAEGAPACVILLTRELSPSVRAQARAAGADEVLPKPAYVGDIVALAQLKLGGNRVHTGELPVPQLVRALLTSGRSGRVRLSGAAAGVIAFRDGQVVDASFQSVSGRRALELLLALGDGALEVAFGPASTGQESVDLRELCTQLLPRLRRFTRVLATSVPLDSVLAVDIASFARAVPSLPHDIDRLARLCDGQRTVRQVLLEAPFAERVALEALTRLYALGAVVPVGDDGAQRGAGLASVLERFAPPAVAQWAASNDERLAARASALEVREGLAPELLKQLDAFQIRVVHDAEPFRFTAEDAQLSEVTLPASAAYELPADEERLLLASATAEQSAALAQASTGMERALRSVQAAATADASPGPMASAAPFEAHAALAAAADEAGRMADPSPPKAVTPLIPSPLLIAGALVCLAAVVAVVRPTGGGPVAVQQAVAVEAPWYQDAVRLYEGGDTASARELLEKAVVADPQQAEIWTYLALARFESGEATAAETAALRALELDPAQPRAAALLEEIARAHHAR